MKFFLLFLTLFCGAALASPRAPLPKVKPDVVRAFYCGPMFVDAEGNLNPVTTKCVGMVLAAGHQAAVGAVCGDGRPVRVLIWFNDITGKVDLQSPAEVCDGVDAGTPPDMNAPPDMTTAKKKRVK